MDYRKANFRTCSECETRLPQWAGTLCQKHLAARCEQHDLQLFEKSKSLILQS